MRVFPTASQEFVYVRSYSRWLEEESRRETFEETATRYVTFMADSLGEEIVTPHYARVAKKAITSMSVMPSMRAMWAAGPAAANNNEAMYNCAYLAVNDLRAFSECLYVLMCGAGVGFSVEQRYISQLPNLKSASGEHHSLTVEDSKAGWAAALLDVLTTLWEGGTVEIDYSLLRPRGARLRTMGGRSSGPEPLRSLFEYLKRLITSKRRSCDYRIQPVEAMDIMNKVAEIVVMGGVRRSSQISLSDLNDREISEAKMGEFWQVHPHRAMSNNSAVYHGRPTALTLLEEWTALIKSGAGERGIFNRDGAKRQMASSGRRQLSDDVGINPCAEILLRDMEFCNLSEVVVRPEDSLADLRAKVSIAAMFGVWQSTFTDFHGLRPEWKRNCEEERLIGVSLTGIMDHPVLSAVSDDAKIWLSDLKATTLKHAAKWANKLGVNMPAAATCVKPSGTVSQLVNCSSGLHARFSQFYIRRYRISATDPLFALLSAQGVPFVPETGQDLGAASTMVLSFPVKAPEGAKFTDDFSAIEQLQHWKMLQQFWCEHNPSATIHVREHEWLDVAAWVYSNFDSITGVAFLPRLDNVYQLAPFEEITEAEYNKMARTFPDIDYSELSNYELADSTDGAKELACAGGACELGG